MFQSSPVVAERFSSKVCGGVVVDIAGGGDVAVLDVVALVVGDVVVTVVVAPRSKKN